MKFIGKLLLWIGGGAMLYTSEPVNAVINAIMSGNPLNKDIAEYLLEFAHPVFVVGVICAAGLPELKARAKKSKPNSAKKDS